MLKTILWDNDGVLVDTERLYFSASRIALARVSLELSPEDFRRISLTAGKSVFELARESGLGEEVIRGLREVRNEEYHRRIDSAENLVIPGIPEVLRELREKVPVMGIVSNSLPDHFDAIHRKSDLLGLFDFYLVNGDYRGSKPDPGPYLAGLEKAGCAAEHALVVEDTVRGLRSALAAGIECVLVPHELSAGGETSGAAAVFDDLRQLPPWLEERLHIQ